MKRIRLQTRQQLEDRLAPAVTASFAAGTLTVNLSAAADAAFLGFDGTSVAVGTTSGGNQVTTQSGVTAIAVRDTGPAASQSVTFEGSTPFVLSGDLSSTGVESVTFNQSVSAGGAIVLNAVDVNSVAAAALTTGSGLTVDNTGSASTLAGAIGGDGGLTKDGAGVVVLSGSTGNTYAGTTQVNQGMLLLGKSGGVAAIPGRLTVGDNLTGHATVQSLQSDQIADSSAVTVNGDGTFDLSVGSEIVGPLSVNDGVVTAGGLLNVSTLSMQGGTILLDISSLLTLRGNVSATSSATGGAAILMGNPFSGGLLSLGGVDRTFKVDDGPQAVDLDIAVAIEAMGIEGLQKTGDGRLALDSDINVTLPNATTVNAGALQVNGTIGEVHLTGGSLSGVGSVGTICGAGGLGTIAVGTIAPGDNGAITPVGVLHTNMGNSSTLLGPGTTFSVDLGHTSPGPPVPGLDYDQLVVSGAAGTNLALNGAVLTGMAGSQILNGDSFTIIRTDPGSGGYISGHFAEPSGPNVAFISGQKFTVEYTPDGSGISGRYDSVVLTRVLATPTLSVTSSTNPSVYGQTVTFTATVTPEAGAGAIPTTDTVTFIIDAGGPGQILRTEAVDATGHATFDPLAFTGQPLSAGQHTVDVTFNGDANFNPASSSLSPHQQINTVNAPTVSDFTLIGAEDNNLTFTTADFIKHFKDLDGDALVAVSIDSLPSGGVLKLDGVVIVFRQVIAAADLNRLVFVPNLNFGGVVTFAYSASDGIAFSSSPATITLNIRSAAQQAADLEVLVNGLSGLTDGQKQALNLNLHNNNGDVGKVRAFLNQVAAFLDVGILTADEAARLSSGGNILLLSVTRS